MDSWPERRVERVERVGTMMEGRGKRNMGEKESKNCNDGGLPRGEPR